MSKLDIIWRQNLDDIKEITIDDYFYALRYQQYKVLIYSCACSAGVVDINKHHLSILIENILTNNECHFDYVIEDFTPLHI